MANKWLVHIKKTMKQMKAKGTYVAGKGLGQVIKAAKKTWHHAKKAVGLKGGAESDSDDVEKTADTTGTEVEPAMPAGGKRHRKTRRRRHSRRR
jgi:hypothetical protein